MAESMETRRRNSQRTEQRTKLLFSQLVRRDWPPSAICEQKSLAILAILLRSQKRLETDRQIERHSNEAMLASLFWCVQSTRKNRVADMDKIAVDQVTRCSRCCNIGSGHQADFRAQGFVRRNG